MECATQKTEINNTLSNVRQFSFDEKRNVLNEEKLNEFLDAILDFKSLLHIKTQKLEDLNPRLEELTWFTGLNDECLMLLNDLISAARDLHSSLIRQYVQLDRIRRTGIAKAEIKRFKNAIDDFKESYTDLESVFFYLPEMPDFVETTKLLSLI